MAKSSADGAPGGSTEIELGTVVGVFGVTGEVRLHLHNPASTLFDRPRPVVLVAPDGSRRVVRLSARSGAGKRILGRFEGLDDRELAATLKGSRLMMAAADLPPEGEGEIYVHRLIGAPVRIGDRVLGRLVDVHDQGPVPIFEVATGEPEPLFVPLLDEFVEAVRPEVPEILLHPAAVEG